MTGQALIDAIFAETPLGEANALALLKLTRKADPEDVALANTLVPEAGDFLPAWSITALIRADISEETAKKEITQQKLFCARLSELLPAIVGFLTFPRRDEVLELLPRLDDLHTNAIDAQTRKRPDRARREAIEAIINATAAVSSAIGAVEAVESGVIRDFNHHYGAFSRQRRKREIDERMPWYDEAHYKDLLEDLIVLRSSLNISHHRATTEDDYLFIYENPVRNDVVGCAYALWREREGPPLVTTPGSEFSAFCSLLYELISGEADESLAGAINRFARSEERAEIDNSWEGSPSEEIKEEIDNFCVTTATIEHATREHEMYSRLVTSKKWAFDDLLLIQNVIDDELKHISWVQSEHGPHLLWPHQLSTISPYDADKRKLLDKQTHLLTGLLRRLRQARR